MTNCGLSGQRGLIAANHVILGYNGVNLHVGMPLVFDALNVRHKRELAECAPVTSYLLNPDLIQCRTVTVEQNGAHNITSNGTIGQHGLHARHHVVPDRSNVTENVKDMDAKVNHENHKVVASRVQNGRLGVHGVRAAKRVEEDHEAELDRAQRTVDALANQWNESLAIRNHVVQNGLVGNNALRLVAEVQ